MSEITITPARYAKNQVAVRCASDSSGYKTRAMRLCDALRGRWSNREHAYIMSERKVERLQRLHANGYDANSFTLDLIPPTEAVNA